MKRYFYVLLVLLGWSFATPGASPERATRVEGTQNSSQVTVTLVRWPFT